MLFSFCLIVDSTRPLGHHLKRISQSDDSFYPVDEQLVVELVDSSVVWPWMLQPLPSGSFHWVVEAIEQEVASDRLG